jgi:hypothetical protein
MRSVTYSMCVSLGCYIVAAGRQVRLDVARPGRLSLLDRRDRRVGVHLLGRRLYETMLCWETADQDLSLDDAELEWAALWKPLPTVVFSTTLPAVEGNARLGSGRPGGGDRAVRAETSALGAGQAARLDGPGPCRKRLVYWPSGETLSCVVVASGSV